MSKWIVVFASQDLVEATRAEGLLQQSGIEVARWPGKELAPHPLVGELHGGA